MVDVGMPARWSQVSSFLCLVTKVFVYIISKVVGLFGGVCVRIVCMDGCGCWLYCVCCVFGDMGHV